MSLWEAIIPAAATIGGAALGVIGNKSASKSQAKALKEANAIEREKLAEGTKQYGEIKEMAAPGISYLRNLIQVPTGGLYADQVAAQEENRRQGLNDLSHSGLRGSGRAVTASLKRIDSDFVNGALAQNRGARQQAATTLTGPFFNAGSNIASATINGGRSEADNVADMGATKGNETLANTQLIGKAIGDIGSLAASEMKGRDSRYSSDDLLRVLTQRLGTGGEGATV
jgi:hypothetical protein